MELNIVSSEIITPSSPTPPHLRTHKLSLLDQVAADCFVPIIFFYSSAYNDANKSSDHLKKSLSRTLTRFYPLAGRIKDEFSVDCDDYGAAFIEARVAGEMSEFLTPPSNDFMEKLMPFKPNGNPSFPVSLIVQVTYFGCGGMAICVGFSHRIADMKTTANFVKSWTAIANGSSSSSDIADGISDCTSIFPPQNLSSLFSSSSLYGRYFLSNNLTKRFVFDGDKIAALQEKMGNDSSSGYRPTRFEVVSALILGGVMTAAAEQDELNYTHLLAQTVVNLRNRMNPPLPGQSFGNIVQLTAADLPIENTIDYKKLTEKLHESISRISDNYVRKIHVDGFLNDIKNAMELSSVNNSKVKQFTISSWCRNSFYTVDFGWGKPIWVGNCYTARDVAILLDSRDDKGIEALVVLPRNEMDKFEKDPGIIGYASVDPSVL